MKSKERVTQFILPTWSLLILLPSFFCNSFVFGQDKEYMKNISSIVTALDDNCKTCDSIILDNEQFLSDTTDGEGQLTVFKCKKHLTKIVEWVGLSYGYRVRTFYTKDEKLVYATEVHNEFLWDKDKDEYDKRSTKRIYSAFYYVESNFYHYGEMRYEVEYKFRVKAPEPIGYVMRLVKTNNEYLTMK